MKNQALWIKTFSTFLKKQKARYKWRKKEKEMSMIS